MSPFFVSGVIMFKVKIEYLESDLTMSEARNYALTKYGKNCLIEFAPISSKPEDIIDFMLQQLVTEKQLDAKFTNHSELYHKKIGLIKSEVQSIVAKRLDILISRNEESL